MSYRFFDTDNKEMIYLESSGLQYYDFEGGWSLGFTVDGYSGFWGHEQYEHMTKKAKKYPVMRCTGVLDKDKKNYIYEGDIVKQPSRDWLYVVERDNMKAGFYLTHISMYPKKVNTYYNRGEYINGKNKIIVGNIYEHPHLLSNQ